MNPKMQHAYDVTPKQFHHFIQDIKGKPYMSVDGRVAMFIDSNPRAGTAIETEFIEIAGQVVCKATIYLAGTQHVTGHARAFMDAERGVDATNPLENAETSAIGRALGFMGYGLFGAGIASAEEVANAIAEQDKLRSSKSTPVPEPAEQYAGVEDEPMSAKLFWRQIRDVQKVSGKSDEELKQYMKTQFDLENTLHLTLEQQEDCIMWMTMSAFKDKSDEPSESDETWNQVKERCEEVNVVFNDLQDYILTTYKSPLTSVYAMATPIAKRFLNQLNDEKMTYALKSEMKKAMGNK